MSEDDALLVFDPRTHRAVKVHVCDIYSMEGACSSILFFVNGQEINVKEPDPEMKLLSLLRNELKLTGSKLACGEGGCGACTVMLSRFNHQSNKVQHYSVCACVLPLCAVDGAAVTTVEGIGSMATELHPCQERIAKAHGSQCGFCTPGFVMSMYTLLRNNMSPSEREIEETLQGNLCRCTGYRAILDGYRTFANSKYCKATKDAITCCLQGTIEGCSVLFEAKTFVLLDPTQEPIFPPALKMTDIAKPLAIRGPRMQWYRPITLNQLLILKEQFPQLPDTSKHQHGVVAGGTALSLSTKRSPVQYNVLISIAQVPELQCVEVKDDGIEIGAAVTITHLIEELEELQKKLLDWQTGALTALQEALWQLGSTQIRNIATIGGSVMGASATSDVIPVLMASRAVLNLAQKCSQRNIILDSSFLLGNNHTAVHPAEVLVSIFIPFTRKNEFISVYKQARRRKVCSAIVNAGLCVHLSPLEPHWLVEEILLCYGGVGSSVVAAETTQRALIGKPWCESTLHKACQLLSEEISLPADIPEGMFEYRQSLVTSFFFKFYLTVLEAISPQAVSIEWTSAIKHLEREPAYGCQGFESVPSAQPKEDMVGRPMMHLSALQQATGEARYVNDMPRIEGELYGALVLSTHSHAKITVDASSAEEMTGVRVYVSIGDVPADNTIDGALVFAAGEVTCIGQVIGMVVAEDKDTAQHAVLAVDITYEDLPSIFTIEEAIAANQYFDKEYTIQEGNVKAAYASAEHTIQGRMKVGGQDHFYMETQGCIAVPKGENGEMEIFASAQRTDTIQKFVAKALGISANRIVARVKRLGGGFGGKVSVPVLLSTAVAIAANKVHAPVRCVLDRDENMKMCGGRHPFMADYKIGFTSEGKITAREVHYYFNGGNTIDASIFIMRSCLLHTDTAYDVPNTLFTGRVCHTNLQSSIAFRGFGRPQAHLMMEACVDHVATHLGISTEKIRKLNLYEEGCKTPYGQKLLNCQAVRCWNELLTKCAFLERKNQVDEFNKINYWKKRGIAVTPVKCGPGIVHPAKFLEQAGALVHVYTDGSVLLTHGGIEMGQGLHTKMVQVCARCLRIPVERVFFSETSTSTVANQSTTSASMSSDIWGMAVKAACEELMGRLEPFMKENPAAGWDAWVNEAYFNRVDLTAHGFYRSPDLDFSWTTGKGNVYKYFIYGAGCSEVEVDTLTGDFHVRRADLLMDSGKSLNPAIDIGQVEGAFIQGMGMVTMEQCVYLEGGADAERGQIYTTGASTYKIPSCTDIPVQLNVTLLDRAPNPMAIFSSKGVGEPPLMLANSVFFAIKDAVKSARTERGLTGELEFNSPATCERIRMACADQFTEQAAAKEGTMEQQHKGWSMDVC